MLIFGVIILIIQSISTLMSVGNSKIKSGERILAFILNGAFLVYIVVTLIEQRLGVGQ